MRTAITTLFCLLFTTTFAQLSNTELCNQTILVNSVTNIENSNRRYVPLLVPPGTVRLVYAIKNAGDGSTRQAINLTAQVAQYISRYPISQLSGLASQIVGAESTRELDVYLITSTEQLKNYISGEAFSYSIAGTAKGLVRGVISLPYISNSYQTLYLGLTNNNLMEGLYVQVEANAITETPKPAPEQVKDTQGWTKEMKEKLFDFYFNSLNNHTDVKNAHDYDEGKLRQVVGCFLVRLTAMYTPEEYTGLAQYEMEHFAMREMKACALTAGFKID